MRSAIALSVAALAGSALAAPSYGRPHQDVHVVVEVETVVHTVYVTEGYQVYKPKHTSKAPVYSHPARPTITSSVYVAPPAPTSEAPKPTTTAVYTPAPQPTTEVYTPAPEPTSEAPAPTTEAPAPSTTAAAPSAAPSASGYMGIVSEWRAKLGLSTLECDSKLESNSMDTVVSGNGVMVHKLNSGTFGQVLAPGEDSLSGFEDVFVGGWLCEKANMAGLEGVCSTASKGWNYIDPDTGVAQTGHAEILTSTNYSKIGCSFYNGIWGCDLA